ncbi:GerAB/ArcD/ProY family transporter [Clostridium sp.]|jgi:spore germination protein|uniref:GerAB/ArcD/ProY family transporter n=1 Tax=Clostridium sp. TaxID=1506 RepID=UPI003EE92CD9
MNKKQITSLTSFEITCILIGTVIGVYMLSSSITITKISHQDGWLSMFLGAIYPLYIVFIAGYIIKKHPKDNILTLSKKYLGVIMGNLLNFVFLLQFILYITFMTSTIINMLITYGISHSSPIKTIFVLITIAAYASSKGIKTLAKINVIAFYILLFLIILSLLPIKYGSILNVMPVGGSGITNVLKGTVESLQSYATVEILLIIHPFAKESKSVKNAALKAILLISIIYTWVIFITIYYLGIELIPHTFWPTIMVFHSVHVALFNNFVIIFMLLWTVLFLKSLVNEYFVITFILNDFIKVNTKKICLFIFPLIVYLSFLFSSDPKFGEYFSSSAIYILLFNISYVTIICLLIFIKPKKIIRSSEQKIPIRKRSYRDLHVK